MTLISVGRYFGILGVCHFCRAYGGWLVYSVYIGIRGERIATKIGAPERVSVAELIKVKDVDSTGSITKDEKGCAPNLDKGKLTLERVQASVETIWGYLPQSDGLVTVLDMGEREVEVGIHYEALLYFFPLHDKRYLWTSIVVEGLNSHHLRLIITLNEQAFMPHFKFSFLMFFFSLTNKQPSFFLLSPHIFSKKSNL